MNLEEIMADIQPANVICSMYALGFLHFQDGASTYFFVLN